MLRGNLHINATCQLRTGGGPAKRGKCVHSQLPIAIAIDIPNGTIIIFDNYTPIPIAIIIMYLICIPNPLISPTNDSGCLKSSFFS